MEAQFDTRQHFDTVVCPKCGKQGSITWDTDGPKTELADISGFYERLCKKAPYPIELVCNGCGTPQKGRTIQLGN
jgi:hypothetical protein